MIYTYQFTLKRIKDGDSLVGDLDLGMRVWMHDVDLRLFAIDTPEIRAIGGKKLLKRYGLTVKQHLEDTLTIGEVYTIKTYKDQRGKFGRVLAKVYHKGLNKRCLNEELVLQHMAIPYNGESREEVQKAHQANLTRFIAEGNKLI